jgi:hypothetical protein
MNHNSLIEDINYNNNLLPIDNDINMISNNEFIFNNIDEDIDLPVVDGVVVETFDDLINQLDNFVNRGVISKHIMTHINYFLYVSRNDSSAYDANYINEIINAYIIASNQEYLNDERELIDKFKDIINQSNQHQMKRIYNFLSGLPY